MSGQHCMLCKLSQKEFDEYKAKDKNGIPWTTNDLIEIGTDATIYGQFVEAAIAGHLQLGLTITPKVHLMLKHVNNSELWDLSGGIAAR